MNPVEHAPLHTPPTGLLAPQLKMPLPSMGLPLHTAKALHQHTNNAVGKRVKLRKAASSGFSAASPPLILFALR
jgi:hypothetical protein